MDADENHLRSSASIRGSVYSVDFVVPVVASWSNPPVFPWRTLASLAVQFFFFANKSSEAAVSVRTPVVSVPSMSG